MSGGDIVMLSMKELRRLPVIHQVMEMRVTQVEAGRVLGLTARQIRRIIKRFRKEGEKAVAHCGRGRSSNRRILEETKDSVIHLYREKYAGFGPTLASEKLFEIEGIKISDETLRLWLKGDGIPYRTRKKRSHRQWRERRGHFGEMVQMDGSHHDWLEGRGSKGVLMAYIDDATGEVFGRFYEYEGTIPAMDSFMRYIKLYGIPQSIYLDKHTTYKSNAKPTIEDELNGRRPMSQFERALSELGVDVIHAHSPQAKGRIERLFGTFQDRVIKEMRLLGINSYEEANRFLESYLPLHNQRFRVPAAQESNLHRSVSCIRDIEQIICIKTGRTIRRDNTIAHDKKLYQIEDRIRGKKMVVEERIDGSMHIRYKGRLLRYREIHAMPVRVVETPKQAIQTNEFKQRRKPDGNHPWRNFRFGRKERERILPVP